MADGTVVTIWIVSPRDYSHSRAFDEVALALCAAFGALGHSASIVRDPAQLAGTTIVLGANLLLRRPRVRFPASARLILFKLEQITPNSPWIGEGYLALLKQYPVWDYSPRNIVELSQLGIAAVHCGIGYMPELTRIPRAEQDVDVLFIGSTNARRLKVLNEIAARAPRDVALQPLW